MGFSDPDGYHARTYERMEMLIRLREALDVLNIPRLREYAEADVAKGERWIRIAPQTFLETVIEPLESAKALLAQPGKEKEAKRG